MKNKFKSTVDLYGVNPSYFEEMKYYEAISNKVDLVRSMISNLQTRIDNTSDWDKSKLLEDRLTQCYKALKFNSKLLDEYKGELKWDY